MAGSLSILTGENPNNISAISLFLVQATIIIATARVLSLGLSYLRQPRVIAEVIGGIILGSSALSKIPAFKTNIFPPESLAGFKLVADFGLILYLFLIGLEMDPKSLISTVRKSIPVSLAGIFLPFVLGVGISKLLFDTYADPGKPFSSFMIFLGVAMSITAFPVLARILTERKLLHTSVGSATISAAAVDDFVAWTLLILVMSLINNTNTGSTKPSDYATAVYVFLIVIGFAVFLWFAVRPGLVYLVKLSGRKESVSQFLLFVVFTLVLASAWFCEVIGVHAIFGSFLVGVVIPHENGFARHLAEQIEDLVTIVFLPLYFAYSGLNTRIDTINDWQGWGFVLLVEIIVLNLGLKAGIINEKIFSIFVCMAVATTVMTVPIVSVIYPESYYMNVNRPEAIDASEVEGASSEDDRDSLKKSPTGVHLQSSNSDLVLTDGALEVRALVCLPSLGAVPSMMSFTTALGASPGVGQGVFLVSALRLIEISERMSSVMLANEYTDTMRTDPILQVFRTFTDLHRIRSKLLLGVVPETRSFSANILSAAKDTSSTLIILPWLRSASETSGDFDERVAKASYDEVMASNQIGGATVVLFMDKGFGRPATAHVGVAKKKSTLALASPATWQQPGSETTQPTSPVTVKPTFDFFRIIQDGTMSVQRGVAVSPLKRVHRAPVLVVVFFGGADDREALRVAGLVAHGAQGVSVGGGGGNGPAMIVVLRAHVGKDDVDESTVITSDDVVAPVRVADARGLGWQSSLIDDATALMTLQSLFEPGHVVVQDIDTSPLASSNAGDDAQLTVQSTHSNRGKRLAIDTMTTATTSIQPTKPLGAIIADAADEIVKKRMGGSSDEVFGGLNGGDLVVVGNGAVKASGTVLGARSGAAGLRVWIENETGASVAVVKAPSGVKGGEKMV
ncbi:K(+)/H(+) antiporter [Dinochytrium kinnereticum]|nr:K(+)/H(+) antiporter [Dinochytrium kinnereticum]